MLLLFKCLCVIVCVRVEWFGVLWLLVNLVLGFVVMFRVVWFAVWFWWLGWLLTYCETLLRVLFIVGL